MKENFSFAVWLSRVSISLFVYSISNVFVYSVYQIMYVYHLWARSMDLLRDLFFFSKCCYKTESGNKIVTPEVWKCPGLHRMWPVPRVLVVDIQWYLGRLFWLWDPQLLQNKMQRSSVVSDERFLTSSSIVFRNWKGSHLKFSWKVFAKYT